ncbi:PREDICTED: translation initiation factor IF-2-like [Chinchilla lanigera]|uniref:translation initiation factor IF-2-like n=1 Tax=Chinchilla lanigera TaxID=34839 RepID=UPI000698019E|nr:PREDICTED: translation initiation factor IF-2-like [Chinchilla lanigera]
MKAPPAPALLPDLPTSPQLQADRVAGGACPQGAPTADRAGPAETRTVLPVHGGPHRADPSGSRACGRLPDPISPTGPAASAVAGIPSPFPEPHFCGTWEIYLEEANAIRARRAIHAKTAPAAPPTAPAAAGEAQRRAHARPPRYYGG